MAKAKATVTTDTSELRGLAADLRAIPEELSRHIYPIVEKAGANVKAKLRDEMSKSTHFRQVAPSIDYDVNVRSGFGVGSYEVEIGPNKERAPVASLALFAYFGDANRSGTVQDPQVALDEETPRFVAELENLLDGLL